MTSTISIPTNRRTLTGQRVALVEVEPTFAGIPAAISERAPGVRRIVRDYGLSGLVADAEALKTRMEHATF
jgi:hypothetical protein